MFSVVAGKFYYDRKKKVLVVCLAGGSSHNETAASAWRQQNADWRPEMKKTTTSIILKILQPIDVDKWIQMMKLLED